MYKIKSSKEKYKTRKIENRNVEELEWTQTEIALNCKNRKLTKLPFTLK